MVKILLFFILLVLCWPLAILVLLLYPLIWLVLLPFRILGFAVGGVLETVRGRSPAARPRAGRRGR